MGDARRILCASSEKKGRITTSALTEVKLECLGKPQKREAKGGSSESLCNTTAAVIPTAGLAKIRLQIHLSNAAANKAPAMIYSANYAAVW